MQFSELRKVVVVGAGTMGSGIAQVSAQAGYETLLFDVSEHAVTRGFDAVDRNLKGAVEKKKMSDEERENTLSRIRSTHSFSDLTGEVFIEAIIEQREAKVELFQSLAKQNAGDALLCTNTSSIPVTRIAEAVPHPERVVGMHFFNPAHLMKLVEVVQGKQTSAANATLVFHLAEKFGKTPVMANDAPGFIVNRIGKLYHTEPLKILEAHLASPETIDGLLEGCGFKMGPFRLIDLIGVDANLNVTKSLYALFNNNPKFKPSELQQRMVDEGKLGKKSGSGFYQY